MQAFLCEAMRSHICDIRAENQDSDDQNGGSFGCNSDLNSIPIAGPFHAYLFRQVHPFPRTWAQLALFRDFVERVWPALGKFPILFCALLIQFDVASKPVERKWQLPATCIFMRLLQRGKFISLEGALITQCWPEFAQDLSSLDTISARKSSVYVLNGVIFGHCSCHPAMKSKEETLDVWGAPTVKKDEDEDALEERLGQKFDFAR